MVKTINVSCYISTICGTIYLYADDILLIAPTISGLQALLRTCENYFNDVNMCVYVKSKCVFGLDGDMLIALN